MEEEYNARKAQAEASRQAYQNAYDTQSNYEDLWNSAQESQGANTAKNEYQKSLEAVNATKDAMTTLPSSINANSNVVLTQAQKNAALNNQLTKYNNSLSSLQNASTDALSAYQQALSNANTLAGNQYNQEQQKLSNLYNIYTNDLSSADTAYANWLDYQAALAAAEAEKQSALYYLQAQQAANANSASTGDDELDIINQATTESDSSTGLSNAYQNAKSISSGNSSYNNGVKYATTSGANAASKIVDRASLTKARQAAAKAAKKSGR